MTLYNYVREVCDIKRKLTWCSVYYCVLSTKSNIYNVQWPLKNYGASRNLEMRLFPKFTTN